MLFENINKFVFFGFLVAFICDGGAGEGAGGHRRRWSGGGGEGSSAAVEQGRVRWVVGGGGAGEGVGGRRRRPVEQGRGCGGGSAVRGPDLARWDSDRDGGGSRSSVHEI